GVRNKRESTSFPTRRSSDLGDYSVSGAAGCGRRRAAAHGAGHHGRYFSAAAAWSGVRALWHYHDHGADDRTHAGRMDHGQLHLADRKSTRLNSSHEWISYAV